jgi:hypothetical protein
MALLTSFEREYAAHRERQSARRIQAMAERVDAILARESAELDHVADGIERAWQRYDVAASSGSADAT